MHHGMRLEALAPIQQIAIVRTRRPSHLWMPLDGRVPMQSEFGPHWSAKGVSPIDVFPVLGVNPASFLPRMPSSGPALQLKPDMAITAREDI